MAEFIAYVGLDVHRDTIAVAVALPGREEPVCRGEIKNQRRSVLRLVRSVSTDGEPVSSCYEVGPSGYGLYREIVETGHHCEVVAPSLIPRRCGERVKTDRRDAVMLARLHRAGELTGVWVPGEEREAMRDMTRVREDLKALEVKAKQRLGACLLRHDRAYRSGKSRPDYAQSSARARTRWPIGVGGSLESGKRRSIQPERSSRGRLNPCQRGPAAGS